MGKQHAMIARLRAARLPTEAAVALLGAFERSLDDHLNYLCRLGEEQRAGRRDRAGRIVPARLAGTGKPDDFSGRSARSGDSAASRGRRTKQAPHPDRPALPPRPRKSSSDGALLGDGGGSSNAAQGRPTSHRVAGSSSLFSRAALSDQVWKPSPVDGVWVPRAKRSNQASSDLLSASGSSAWK